ncbi:MAG: cell division ATPase MinD [Candidatus Hadarchaeaceae archaeon]
MTRIITFASSKGGTGKTLVVANLGVAMAQLGQKVMLLDADITMANLAIILGLGRQKTTLHEVLAGEARISKAIYNGPHGVRVVPSGISLNGIQRVRLDRLKKVVDELARKSEFLLIDAPSGLGRDAIIALTMAREMVLVVTPDIASLSNALRTKIIAERFGVKPAGVIVTRITGGHVDIPINEIASTLELPVLATIPEDPEVRRSVAFGEPVVTFRSGSPAAREFKKLASALVRASPAS